MKISQPLKELSLSQIKAQRCKNRFYYFFCEFWETIEAVELIPNWHIEFICDQLQEVYETWETGSSQDDVIINVPPGSSKSTICTQLFPVWLWLKNPSIRIISSSYSSDLSTAHAVKSRNCIGSDKFKLYFSNQWQIKSGEDNKTWYKNTKLGERYATSTGGTVTGMHADFIIVDDPINPKQSQSETQRQAANSHLKETLSTRKTDKNRTVTILIMQRLHELDPTGLALKEKPDKVRHICLPGELSKEVTVSPSRVQKFYKDGLLDEKRLNREALNTLKIDLGSYGYSGQIKQRPSPEGGGKLKRDWFRVISYKDFQEKINGKVFQQDFFLDTSYTEDKKNDPTAHMSCVYFDNNLYILDSISKHLEFPDLIKYIPEFVKKTKLKSNPAIRIEPKASGKSTKQTLAKNGFNAIELPSPKDSKIVRVDNIAPFVEAGRCFVIDGAWNDSFLSECADFPNAAHDDQVDNLTAAIEFYDANKGRIRSTV